MRRAQRVMSFAMAAILVGLIGVPAFAFLATSVRDSAVPTWIYVANLSDLPLDGQPTLHAVQIPDNDGWVRHPDVVIGSVFLRRLPDDRQVLALSQCSWRSGLLVTYHQQARVFWARCWNIRFDLDGKELAENDNWIGESMPQFPVRVVDGEVFVDYSQKRVR